MLWINQVNHIEIFILQTTVVFKDLKTSVEIWDSNCVGPWVENTHWVNFLRGSFFLQKDNQMSK